MNRNNLLPSPLHKFLNVFILMRLEMFQRSIARRRDNGTPSLIVRLRRTYCNFSVATIQPSVYKEHSRAHNEATDTKQSLLMHTLVAAALPAPIPKRVDSTSA